MRYIGRAGGLRLGLGDVGDRLLGEHRARRLGGLREDTGRVGAERPVEQLDDLQHGDLGRRPGRSCSRP